jgi:hypothetical protein
VISVCAVSLAAAAELRPQGAAASISSPIPVENWSGLYATGRGAAGWFSPELSAYGAAGVRQEPLSLKGGLLEKTKFSLPSSPSVGVGRRADVLPAQSDRLVYGALRTFVAPAIAPSAGALAKRLVKAGAEVLARAMLFGPNGPLSTAHAQKSIDDRELIVQGVNDEEAAIEPTPDGTEGVDAVKSYPLSAAALADQQAREARFGSTPPDATPPDAAPTQDRAAVRLAALPAGERPHIIDASEGTPLDPLLNKTYDLNYAKKGPPSGDVCLKCK